MRAHTAIWSYTTHWLIVADEGISQDNRLGSQLTWPHHAHPPSVAFDKELAKASQYLSSTWSKDAGLVLLKG